jgi:carboxymethylenebutenolidase
MKGTPVNTQSKWIDIQVNDGVFGAYLATPSHKTGPGIVLTQEIFGVNDHIREVADQYAADGYVVLAPDLFWRSEPRVSLKYEGDDMKRAVELMQQTDAELAVSDIGATAQALRGLIKPADPIAAIGYCLGGRLAYKTAAAGLVDKAVAYYGGGIHTELELAGKVQVPILFHFGEADSHIPASAVAEIKASFASHRNAEFHIYPDAEHGFNCSHRGSYSRHASALAHGHTLVFLEGNDA